jgi:hypothetical protein
MEKDLSHLLRSNKGDFKALQFYIPRKKESEQSNGAELLQNSILANIKSKRVLQET